MAQTDSPGPGWTEDDSTTFLDLGHYAVPDRERQIDILCALVPAPTGAPCHVIDLCCGEGLLSHAILDRFPRARVHGYDGSTRMMHAAADRNAPYGERFDTTRIELGDTDWRTPPWPVTAVLSSLAIHHLDGEGKRALFGDVYRMLEPGGAFVIADLVAPTTDLGVAVAAQAWDDAVAERGAADGQRDAVLAAFRTDQWNLYRYPDPEVDRPSALFDQLRWLAAAGFEQVDVHWMRAGHAIFGGRTPA